MNKPRVSTIRNKHRKLVKAKMVGALSEVAKLNSMTVKDLLKNHPDLKERAWELARASLPSFKVWAAENGFEDIVLEGHMMASLKKRPRPKTYKKGGEKKKK